jgi:hypothetical protein
MSYHIFPNPRKTLPKDLSKKLTNGVKSMDFKVRDCNCRGGRGTGKCQYRSMCRVLIIIYIVEKHVKRTYFN